jgi:hypothetical protein
LAGTPNSLIVDAGTVGVTTTGAKEIVINQTLSPGIVWLAMVSQVATCSTTYMPTMISPIAPYGANTPSYFAGLTGELCQYESSISGALPSSAAANNSGSCPMMVLRAA